MKRYKILIVLTPSLDPNAGGVQMTTTKMSAYFSELGHDVAIYSFSEAGHKYQGAATLYYAKETGSFHNPANLAFFREVISSRKPDIAINQMPYDHPIGRVLLEEKGKCDYLLLGCLRNTLYSVRYNLDSYRKNVVPVMLQPLFKNKVGNLLLLQYHKIRHRKDLKKILDTYDFFVMFGAQNREELRYFVGDYKSEKLAFIPNSIPDVLPHLPKKEKVILFLGRLSIHQKRVDLLLPLWKRILQQLPDWEFWIVGDGPEYLSLQRQIQDQRIERIQMWGKQAPYRFFEQASVFVMTSSYEGFPNVLVEAQSRGCVPVVMSSYPIVNMIIDNEVNGVLVQPFDVDAMAEDVVRLAQSEELLGRLASNALKNATRFVIERVGSEWESLFDQHANKDQPHSEMRTKAIVEK